MRTLPGAARVCGADGARTSRSRHHRNAARVLPLPVGAWMSVWRPVEIDAQPPTCAGVGASKADSNQARTAGENGASESVGGTAAAIGGSLCAVADMRRLGVRVVAVTGREFYSRPRISIECSTPAFGPSIPANPGHWTRLCVASLAHSVVVGGFRSEA